MTVEDPRAQILAGVDELQRRLDTALADDTTDAQKITDLTAEIAAARSDDTATAARIADLERQVSALTPRPTLYGFWPGQDAPGGGESWTASLARVSGYLGAPGALRDFPTSATIPKRFAGTRVQASAAQAVVQSYTKVPLPDWLSGRAGDALAAYLDTVPPGVDYYFDLHHEPYPELTTAQIAAMWATTLPRLPKKPNLHPTMIAMRHDLTAKRWSDDAVVDGIEVLAWDAYLTRSNPTLAETFEPVQAVSDRLGVGFGVAETAKAKGLTLGGMTEDATASALVNHLRSGLPKNTRFVTWFETNKIESNGAIGDWRMRQYPAAVAAWRA